MTNTCMRIHLLMFGLMSIGDVYLSDSDDHAKELLGAVKESPVLRGVAHLDQLSAGQQLHDQPGGDDWRDAEFHQGSSVRGQDHTDPVEGVRRV